MILDGGTLELDGQFPQRNDGFGNYWYGGITIDGGGTIVVHDGGDITVAGYANGEIHNKSNLLVSKYGKPSANTTITSLSKNKINEDLKSSVIHK